MTQHITRQDFDCFPLFQNVIKTKLIEAQQYLKKLELYKASSDLFNQYLLDGTAGTYDDINEFIAIVHKQCAAWRMQSHEIGQIQNSKYMEEIARKMEATIDHVLFYINVSSTTVILF